MRFNENNLETIKKTVQEKVDKAILNAFDEDVFVKDFSRGRISFGEAINKLNASKIHVDTIGELRMALELLSELKGLDFLKDKKNIDNNIAHENAHANKTEELKANLVGYEFALLKRGTGYFIEELKTISGIPKDWDEQKKIQTMLDILNAPVEYGEQLSEDDIAKINTLKKDYYDKK